MEYEPFPPNHAGIQIWDNLNLEEIARYIDWKFFFQTWRIIGKYENIEKVCDCASCTTAWLQNFSEQERSKAKEALRLFKDAQERLKDLVLNKKLSAKALVGIFHAKANNNDILIENGREEISIPTLRQQTPNENGYFLALADFISPQSDFIGCFANTIHGAEEVCKQYAEENDDYNALLVQTLADRLAEATTEWLHEQVRKKIWGFSSNESLSIEEMKKARYQGIRPAVGYPSLPDQSIMFEMEKIIPLHKIGLQLTENGAMIPSSSICGFIIAHPQARYFIIPEISETQLSDYAARRKIAPEKIRPFISSNIV